MEIQSHNRMTQIQGQVAIVTGGSSGIGRATAVALAREGAKVVVVGRNTLRIDETISIIRDVTNRRLSTASPLGLALDVRSESDMIEMAQTTMDKFGRIDILVAAAGTGGSTAMARRLPYAIVQMPVEEWDEVIDTNLKGIFLSNRAVLPAMMWQRRGNIINISSSRGATYGIPYSAAYSASKHGVMGLSEALAEETRSYGIKVHVVLPDVTDTPLMNITGNIAPYGLLKPESVANFILHIIVLPFDTILTHPLIAPFPVCENDKTLLGDLNGGRR